MFVIVTNCHKQENNGKDEKLKSEGQHKIWNPYCKCEFHKCSGIKTCEKGNWIVIHKYNFVVCLMSHIRILEMIICIVLSFVQCNITLIIYL